jgi:hypothetical protein
MTPAKLNSSIERTHTSSCQTFGATYTMLRVYCDTGGYKPELKALESAGRISVYQFMYENWNSKIRNKAVPSQPTWKELNYKTWKHLDGFTWDDFERVSDRRVQIEALLGPENLRDAKHLDSAYMTRCQVFLTSDKDDIASRAIELEALLGFKVFHVQEGWQAFLELVASDA